ncbi:hypothetical protein TCDM_13605 [Trypanosoma cruzi Dm28c]|uniref:Uncharacterized protein n=1 Tax=Trypanosoma cruzi Dm28c TaxID=1416333 RepID=V5A2E6_TRYCR|nr:hypothetical protein TCDM_13605 [Trypanosoma cruzi Dm28c]
MGCGAQLNAVTRGAPHPQEKRLGVRAPSPPFSSSWTRKKATAATRNCQHAPQKEHSNLPQCASCVCVVMCACRNTRQKGRKEGAECFEGRRKLCSGDAWRKQQQ